jgi:hypothetical protein
MRKRKEKVCSLPCFTVSRYTSVNHRWQIWHHGHPSKRQETVGKRPVDRSSILFFDFIFCKGEFIDQEVVPEGVPCQQNQRANRDPELPKPSQIRVRDTCEKNSTIRCFRSPLMTRAFRVSTTQQSGLGHGKSRKRRITMDSRLFLEATMTFSLWYEDNM